MKDNGDWFSTWVAIMFAVILTCAAIALSGWRNSGRLAEKPVIFDPATPIQ